MTTKVKAHIAKCSHCSDQCWQLTELDFSVNQLLFFSYYYNCSVINRPSSLSSIGEERISEEEEKWEKIE